MCNKAYNGYSNYETWLVGLWLDNDEYLCNHLIPDMAREAVSAYRLADDLREFVDDPENGLVPDLGASLASDLLSAALGEVNWAELAENYFEEYHEEEESDEDVNEAIDEDAEA